jgi:hypothetical protein
MYIVHCTVRCANCNLLYSFALPLLMLKHIADDWSVMAKIFHANKTKIHHYVKIIYSSSVITDLKKNIFTTLDSSHIHGYDWEL